MTHVQLVPQKVIYDGLAPLGGPIVKTIVWHLRANGVFLESEGGIDLRTFYQHLEGIVGNIADIVTGEIYEELSKKYPNSSKRFERDVPVLDRIERLLQVESGSESTEC